jgi:hypothetical protein
MVGHGRFLPAQARDRDKVGDRLLQEFNHPSIFHAVPMTVKPEVL